MNANANPNPPTSHAAPRRGSIRRRAMLWSFLFIAVAAMLPPMVSTMLPFTPPPAHAQVQDGENQRANFWRMVRRGEAGYSAVSGAEAGVFINNGGQNWRQMRNAVITNYGGAALIGALVVLALFYAIRGRIPLARARSGLTVPRWRAWERVMHWATAAMFVLLAVSGLSLLFGRAVLAPLLGRDEFGWWANLCITAHNYIGPVFSVGVLAMLVFWVRNNIPNATDWRWLAAGGGLLKNNHPSAGKANGGEKIWFWVVILLGLVMVCVSGLGLLGWLGWLGEFGLGTTRADMQGLHQIHAIAALLWVAIFFGHAYIGSIGTEGALEGMTRGRVSVEWAEQHHDLWYAEVKGDADRANATATAH